MKTVQSVQLVLLGCVHRDPEGEERLRRILEEIRPAAVSLEVSPVSVRVRQQKSEEWLRIYRERLIRVSRKIGQSLSLLETKSHIQGVFEYLRLPYEYRGCIDFAQFAACPLFLLDDSKLAESFLGRVEEELLSEENLILLARAATNGTLAQEVESQYRRAHHYLFQTGSETVPLNNFVKDTEAWSERESNLAQKIRLLHQGLVRRVGRRMSGSELGDGLFILPEAIGYMPDEITLNGDAPHVYICGWEHLVIDSEGGTLYNRLKDLDPVRRLCHDPERLYGPNPTLH